MESILQRIETKTAFKRPRELTGVFFDIEVLLGFENVNRLKSLELNQIDS